MNGICLLMLCLRLAAVMGVQTKPEIHAAPGRVRSAEIVWITGSGFAPNHSLVSHLLKPDGEEYNPLRLRTNERGEFAHRIDTTMLEIGTFELWVEDEAAHVTSNRVQFTVESHSGS